MNREIKFRALEQIPSIIKGLCPYEWVYGTGVFEDPENTWLHSHDDTKVMAFGMSKSVVKPETVGQFTGLQDKNGKDIYEGDIIQYSYTLTDAKLFTGVVEYHTKLLEIGWEHDPTLFVGFILRGTSKHGEWYTSIPSHTIADIEIIGNIHENQELLI